MLGMHWTWRDVHDCPPYVRRYVLDLLNIRGRCLAERQNAEG